MIVTMFDFLHKQCVCTHCTYSLVIVLSEALPPVQYAQLKQTIYVEPVCAKFYVDTRYIKCVQCDSKFSAVQLNITKSKNGFKHRAAATQFFWYSSTPKKKIVVLQ